MKVNRIRKIEELLQDMHSLSIDYLCEYFNVSKNTIRRDIAEMDKSGYIKKVYGGIVLNENEPAPQESVPEHNWVMNTTNLEEKKKIAQLAADLVDDEDVIYIDIGTTTALLLPYIENKKNVTVDKVCFNIIKSYRGLYAERSCNEIFVGMILRLLVG